MSEVQQIGAFTVGRDVSLVITGPDGVITTSPVTQFYVQQMVSQTRQKGLGNPLSYSTIPEGWMGHFIYDRSDSVIDDLFTDLEAQYYNEGVIRTVTFMQVITNPDGSVSRTRYTGVALDLEEAGHFAGDERVRLKVTFRAARRVRA